MVDQKNSTGREARKVPQKKDWLASRRREMVAGVVVYQRRPLPDPSFRLVIFSLSGFRLLFFLKLLITSFQRRSIVEGDLQEREKRTKKTVTKAFGPRKGSC